MNHPSIRRSLAVLMLAVLTLASAGAASLPFPTPEATSSITVRDLKRHLSFLASEELGGRYTFSPSNLIAARYLASQLESYGYRGAGRKGSFFQRVPLSFRNVDIAASRVMLNDGAAKREFVYGDAFVAEVPTNINVSGDMVFVGYGLSSPRNNHDDYAGLDVKGKIVVMSSGLPESLAKLKLTDEEQAEAQAAAHGAIGIIRVPDAQTLMTWQQLKVEFGGQQQLGLPPKPSSSGKVLPQITAGPELIKALAKSMGKESSDIVTPRKTVPVELASTVEIKLRVAVKDAPPAQNV